jgi:hypothetical protein
MSVVNSNIHSLQGKDVAIGDGKLRTGALLQYYFLYLSKKALSHGSIYRSDDVTDRLCIPSNSWQIWNGIQTILSCVKASLKTLALSNAKN